MYFFMFYEIQVKNFLKEFTYIIQYISCQSPIINFIPMLSHKPYLGPFKLLWWTEYKIRPFIYPLFLLELLLNTERHLNKMSPHKICENAGFHWPVLFRTRKESTILSLNGRMQVSKNPCSHIFYAVVLWYEMSHKLWYELY